MNRHVLIFAALACLPLALRAQSTETGTVTGRVLLTTRMRGAALPSTLYQPRAVGTHEVAPVPEIRNVVVQLKNPGFKGALAVTRREIRQEHEAFVPRVVAITKGSSVEFPNDDPVFHNVFSLASAASFDLGRYPKGRTKSATFTKAGIVKVFCHLHSQMSASIMVLDHPYFTQPVDDGTFTIENVPPGAYTVAGWHERVGERLESVVVTAGQRVDVTLSLPVEDVP